jgi:hypothetical protein
VDESVHAMVGWLEHLAGFMCKATVDELVINDGGEEFHIIDGHHREIFLKRLYHFYLNITHILFLFL